MTPPGTVDAAVIGGGPAGSAIGRLLASWGHSVLILDKAPDPSRGLAESLPPSTAKLLAQIGVLDAVDRAGFCRTRGNTAWWASTDRRVETFGPDRDALGYQVFRPDFDRVLLESAESAGARVARGAQVRQVALAEDLATLTYAREAGREAPGRAQVETVKARFALDCSGRAAVLGRRFRAPETEFRTYALVGAWSAAAWDLPDPTHTSVETFADGWAWSVPIDLTRRHVGVMVGHALPDPGHGADLMSTYRALLAKASNTSMLTGGGTLERVWACDASLYSAARYAGPQFLLVGDAGSFIDPLSSFGVKKALASAWVGAVAVHTALSDAGRRDIALEFFGDWERRMYATHLARSREFARAAHGQHPHGFWSIRGAGGTDAADSAADDEVAGDPEVRRAFERVRTAPQLDLVVSETVRFEPRPVIRGREIVLEPALAGGMRYHANVDLLALARIAPSCRHVPDVFEAYCRCCPPVPLPSVLGGLSLLVARGVLHERT